MMDEEREIASPAAGLLDRLSAFPTERYPGEALMLAPEERRRLPPKGLQVLLLGPSVAALMIQSLLFDGLPAVARIEAAADRAGALASIAQRPDAYDLVLVVDRVEGRDALAFAEELRRNLDAAAGPVPGPLVVALVESLPRAVQDLFRRSGACAATLLLPMSHARFAALVRGLYRA